MKFVLIDDERRRRAIAAVENAPVGHVVVVKQPTRSLEQNALMHKLFGKMEGVPWYGKARSSDDWKTLLISGHTVATGGVVEVITGLEGELVNIRESTALMSKARGSSLIDYSQAFLAMMLNVGSNRPWPQQEQR